MSNPITDRTINIVIKEGPSRGFLSLAPVLTESTTPSGKRKYKVLFARKPFSFGEIVRGTLDKLIFLDEDKEDPLDLIIKALQLYRQEHKHDAKVWYDELSKEN